MRAIVDKMRLPGVKRDALMFVAAAALPARVTLIMLVTLGASMAITFGELPGCHMSYYHAVATAIR